MNKPTIDEILAPKPEARPRIYAYSIADAAHNGLLKVGQTLRDVKRRIAEQLKTAAIKNYTIELDESAERDDGTIFTDHQLRAALDLNESFEASGTGAKAQFKHKSDVQKWLDIIRGEYMPKEVEY